MSCGCNPVFGGKNLVNHYFNCKSVWDEKKDGPYPLNDDGSIKLFNSHIETLDKDILYHIGFDTEKYDLPALFGDVKFVCMGGAKTRMRDFAEYMHGKLNITKPSKMVNLTKHSHRYAMYKVGPVICVNHGMGMPSMTILLQEIIKLLHYAKAKDPIIIRIGTSGGLGVEPGTVIVSEFGMNGLFEKSYNLPILGELQKFPSTLDKKLREELLLCSDDNDGFLTQSGGTMAADDFYRGQARLDGPFCQHTEAEKLAFLKKLAKLNVKNIEMEATAFAAFTKEAGVKAAVVCVTYLNRLNGDQVTLNESGLKEFQKRPMIIVGRYIAKFLANTKRNNCVH